MVRAVGDVPSIVNPDSRSLGWPPLGAARAVLRSALDAVLMCQQAGFNVLLHGAPGTDKTSSLRALIAEPGASGFNVDQTDGRWEEASRDTRLASLRRGPTFAHQPCQLLKGPKIDTDCFDEESDHC
jgi:hypothetical protein